MSEGNMAEHLTNFMNAVDKLNEMEIMIFEDLLTILLLFSIPDVTTIFVVQLKLETNYQTQKI